MNNADRKTIAKLVAELEPMIERLAEIAGEVQELAEAEREKFDNMPEGLQQSERGQAIDAAASALESAQSDLEGVDLTDVTAYLEEAAGG